MDSKTFFLNRHKFDFFNVSKRLETIPPLGWDRGRSSIHILRSLYGVDWEDMVQVEKIVYISSYNCCV